MEASLLAAEQTQAEASKATEQASKGAAPKGVESEQQSLHGKETAGDKPAEKKGEAKPADQAKRAPELYEFKTPKGLPQGHLMQEAVLDVYTDIARELDLSQEGAQKLLDKVLPAIHQQGTEELRKTRAEWVKQVNADKELGGDKASENLAVAKKALDRFGSPALRELLNGQLGLGDHPEVIRLFFKIGKAISEDRFVAGREGTSVDLNDMASMARKMYPKNE